MTELSSSSALVQPIHWLALEFRVPEAWEIVRHGIRFESGSLVFVDRARQRLSVSWTECPRAPDLERLFSDFETRSNADGELSRNQRDCAGFRVLECIGKSAQPTTHALRYEPRSKRLIELEFAHDGAVDEHAFVDALLSEFVFAERNQSTRLQAFAVRADLPRGFELSASEVKPADVSFEFVRAAERRQPRLRIRRSGMARAWFDGDISRALRQRNPELRFDELESIDMGPHRASSGLASPRVAPLARLFKRASPVRVTSWHCPAENALFELTEPSELPRRERCRLWCCAEAEKGAQDEH
ncbi:MAG TPA: hypothetical protein VGM44_01950 [Polyangiaceae bacterium]